MPSGTYMPGDSYVFAVELRQDPLEIGTKVKMHRNRNRGAERHQRPEPCADGYGD